ncbi:MAG TPA: hypothetical protein VLZ72_10935, partial [Flavobacterium sp.]|nr:hypothetical protein [Flavobacterium sp.]
MISQYFKKIFRFAKPYKKYMYLNIFFNIFYALFSALSFVALIPMLTVMFGDEKKIYDKPIYEGMSNLKDYVMDYMNYYITTTSEDQGIQYALNVMILVVISLFLLKNLSNYW